MNPEVFIELGKILVITVLVSGLIRLLKQPLIIGYILSGIIVGPFMLNLISSTDTFTAFSQIGVALLLFMVGLNLNPKVIKDVGKTSIITGIGQVIFTSALGFLIARLMGFTLVVALYIGIALAFSSTIIIMKLLSDKKELESLYGRISIGFLIVQDFIAIAILLIISSITKGTNLGLLAFESILKGVGAILVLILLTIFILPRITNVVAKSQEFLLLFSLGWCFAVASIFYYLNFSIEAGALLAGVTLSLSPYHHEIGSKLRPLRDFFIILFFILLGAQMTFSNIVQNIAPIIIFSLFVLFGNPLIVMILMGSLGYTKRNSFLAGLTVAQISEFSLIIVAVGVSIGHLSSELLSLITAVALITFAGSTYMILYSHKLYPHLSKYISIFERKGKKVDEHKYHTDEDYDIILVGYDGIGFGILQSLKNIKKKFLIVDYNPDIVIKLSKEGYHCKYGDANDSELLNELNFGKSKMIISTIPVMDTNLMLIEKIREENKKAIIAVVSHEIDDAVRLYNEGATYVLMPHFLGGRHFSTMIEDNKLNINKFLKEKIIHVEHLKKRKEMVHGHARVQR